MNGLFACVYATDSQVAIYLDWKLKQEKHPEFSNLTLIQQLHHLCLSGTTAATVMGINPWQTADELIAYMNWEKGEKEQSFAMQKGSALESPIRDFVVKKLHLTDVEKDKLLLYPQDPKRTDELWSSCQIDTIATLNGEKVIVEIKTASNPKEWGRGCKINDNGEIVKTDNKIPTHYYLQVQKQMDLSQIHTAFVAVLIGNAQEPRIFKIDYDAGVADQIARAEVNLLFGYIIPNKKLGDASVVPEEAAENTHKTLSWVEFFNDKNSINTAYHQYRSAKEALNNAKQEFEKAEENLKKLTKDYDKVLAANGRPFIVRTSYTTERFDSKRLMNEKPEIYAAYLKETNCTRFTVKNLEEIENASNNA